MHATVQKKLKEILRMLEGENRIFIFGCGSCATQCMSGGRAQVDEMSRQLEDAGKIVAGTHIPETCCSQGTVRKAVLELRAAHVGVDSYLVLACGQAVHTVIDATDGALVHPGCDTVFGGETHFRGVFKEYCALCGDCISDRTGGLCPLTLCSKGLLNGPCGGSKGGRCEVDRQRDCGWVLIYERMKTLGKLENLKEIQAAPDRIKSDGPRRIEIRNGQPVFIAGGKEFRSSED